MTSTRGRKALSAPPHATVRDVWRRWVSGGVIDEFSRVENIKGQRGTTVLSSVSGRRSTVAAAVGSLPAGDWVQVDDLFARMRRRGLDPTVERNARSLWRLYLAEPQYGSLGDAGYHGWEILQGRWAADDLAYLSRYDGLTAVRVNDLGAYVLEITDRPPAAPAPTAALKVLPNHEVVAVGDLPPGQAMTLSAFAERTAERAWRLSMASLLSGIAGDPRTGPYCRRVGDRHVAVPAEHDLAFRDKLVDLGYALPLATH